MIHQSHRVSVREEHRQIAGMIFLVKMLSLKAVLAHARNLEAGVKGILG